MVLIQNRKDWGQTIQGIGSTPFQAFTFHFHAFHRFTVPPVCLHSHDRSQGLFRVPLQGPQGQEGSQATVKMTWKGGQLDCFFQTKKLSWKLKPHEVQKVALNKKTVNAKWSLQDEVCSSDLSHRPQPQIKDWWHSCAFNKALQSKQHCAVKQIG